MTDATELDEAAVRARCEAATKGPWEATPNGRVLSLTWPCDDVAGRFGNQGVVTETLRNPDAEFIAHARTDLPAALDEITRLWAALDEAEFHIRQITESRDRAEWSAEAAEKERDEARAEAEQWHIDMRLALGALAMDARYYNLIGPSPKPMPWFDVFAAVRRLAAATREDQ